jgi:hypothetical protein
MRSVPDLELLEKETLLFMVPIKGVQARDGNLFAIPAKPHFAIELIRHFMICGQMKKRSIWP